MSKQDSSTRVYNVKGPNNSEALVKASNQSQAIRHVVRKHYKAEVASQADLIRLVGAGRKVETASAEEA